MRPDEAGPCSSESCPRGKPPASSASTAGTPVAKRPEPPVFPAQRRRVPLQLSRAEQILEGGLGPGRTRSRCGQDRARGGGGGCSCISLFLRL